MCCLYFRLTCVRCRGHMRIMSMVKRKSPQSKKREVRKGRPLAARHKHLFVSDPCPTLNLPYFSFDQPSPLIYVPSETTYGV